MLLLAPILAQIVGTSTAVAAASLLGWVLVAASVHLRSSIK